MFAANDFPTSDFFLVNDCNESWTSFVLVDSLCEVGVLDIKENKNNSVMY